MPRGGMAVTASFTVPEAKYGIHYVQFMQLDRNDPVNFQFIVKPSLRVNPTSAEPGTSVTIKGTGFPARDTGRLTFDGKTTNLVITTDNVGSFTVNFTVPDAAAREYKLVADTALLYTSAATKLEVIQTEPQKDDPDIPAAEPDTGNEATFGTALDTRRPPQSVTISPMGQRFGFFGAKPVTFSWGSVSDPSGITYTLEIADNVNFLPLKPGMHKTGLAQTHYTVDIEPGTYYWRVKAVDGAGNNGYWAYAPYPFKVGEFSSLIRTLINFFKT